MKVVINTCYGGFGLSQAAYQRLIELGVPEGPYIKETRNPTTERYNPEPRNEGIIFNTGFSAAHYWGGYFVTEDRAHSLLVQVVEELGAAANGECADLKVVEIPDGTDYTIEEYDGIETIHEAHRSWR